MRIGLIFVIIILIIVGVAYFFLLPSNKATDNISDSQLPLLMIITSPAFSHNGQVPKKYTCDGEDINPPLVLGGVPESAKSLVLIVDDPDAPRGTLRLGSGQAWVHWTVWNINPQTTAIAENGVPTDAVEGTTDFGRTGWGGPCPPSGTHRYFFKIYALKTSLDLPSTARKTDLEKAMEGHILDQAELIGLYKRQ